MESSLARPAANSQTPLLARIVGVQSQMQARDAAWGYVFLFPWLFGLVVFWLGPILMSFVLSFTQYDVISAPRFIGLANYAMAFFNDKLFWPSILRTIEYSAVVVPVGLLGALGLAGLLNRGVRGTNIFRASFFIPTLTPSVALVMVWKWLLEPSVGPINFGLKLIGIHGPIWLASP